MKLKELGLTERVGAIASTDRGPTFSLVEVKLEPGTRVRPGELLAVPVEETKGTAVVIGRVVQAKEENEYARPHNLHVKDLVRSLGYAGEQDERGVPESLRREDRLRKYRVADVEPLEEIFFSNEKGSPALREPQTLIPAESPVYRCPHDYAVPVLGILDHREADEDGLWIGYTVGALQVPIILSANRIVPHHCLLVGTTGSGKSYLRGVLAEELHILGIPQVNIDVHGELVDATRELGGINFIPGDTLTVKLSSLTEIEVLELVPNLTENQEELVRRAFVSLKERQRSKEQDFGLDNLLEEIKKVGELLGGKSGQSTSKSAVTIDLALARTQAIGREEIIGEKGIDWEKLLTGGAFVNIDCRGLTLTKLRVVAAAIGRELLTLRQRKVIPPVVFSVDEAHLFIPPLTVEDTPSAQVVRELVRFGRHYGIGVILSTQSPLDIDRKTIRITNTRFIFTIEKEQLEALQGVFSDAPEELIERLPKMERGTCLLTGSLETIRHAVPVKVRKRLTTHGGETPNLTVEVRKLGWDRSKAGVRREITTDEGKEA